MKPNKANIPHTIVHRQGFFHQHIRCICMWFPYVSMQTMTLIMHGYMSGYTWWTWRWCLVMPFQMYGIYRNQALPKRETCSVPWNDENVFGDPDSCSLVESRPGFEGLLKRLVGSAVFSTRGIMILIDIDILWPFDGLRIKKQNCSQCHCRICED